MSAPGKDDDHAPGDGGTEGERLREMRVRLAAVPDSMALLEGIFAFAPVGFQIYDAAGRSLLTNKAFRDLFGSEPPPGYNVLQDEIAEAHGMLPLIRRAFAGAVVSTPPIWYDPRDLTQVTVLEGRRVAVSTTFFPLRARGGAVSHVAVVFKDVTAELSGKLRAEEAAQHSANQEKWLELILNLMPTPLLFVEPGTARVFFANAAADRIAGGSMPRAESADDFARHYPCSDMDGRPIPSDEMPAVRAARGDPHSAAMIRWHLPGGDKTVRIESSRLPAAYGHPETVLMAFDDVTAMKEVEAQLQEAVRVREDFVSIAGHEMKTPLTALDLTLTSLTRLLQRRGAEPEVDARIQEKVAAVDRQVRRLNRLVNQLLDVSRITAGRFQLEHETFDLVELTRSTGARVTDELGAPPSQVQVDGDPSVVGTWDRLRVDQVLTNLISNAVKYGDRKPVDVSLRRTDQGARLTVRDRGIGIDVAHQTRIFERFERAVSDRNFGGLGLGLWIVRQIVEAMGGQIRVESTPGQGSMFVVDLPSQGTPDA